MAGSENSTIHCVDMVVAEPSLAVVVVTDSALTVGRGGSFVRSLIRSQCGTRAQIKHNVVDGVIERNGNSRGRRVRRVTVDRDCY